MNLGMVPPSKGVVPKGTHEWLCQVPGHSPKLEQDQVVETLMKSTPMTLRSYTLKRRLIMLRSKCWRSSPI